MLIGEAASTFLALMVSALGLPTGFRSSILLMRPFQPAAGLPGTLATDPSSVMSLWTLPGPPARLGVPNPSVSECLSEALGLSMKAAPIVIASEACETSMEVCESLTLLLSMLPIKLSSFLEAVFPAMCTAFAHHSTNGLLYSSQSADANRNPQLHCVSVVCSGTLIKLHVKHLSTLTKQVRCAEDLIASRQALVHVQKLQMQPVYQAVS